jgi:hypothetical protein
LSRGTLRASNQGLIDSGADGSAFPRQMLQQLGLSEADCKEETFNSAAGGGVQWVYEPGFWMTVLGYRFKTRAVFCDTPVPLLGRADFFRRFRVDFDERGQRFTVTPY